VKTTHAARVHEQRIIDTYLKKLVARDRKKKFVSDDLIGVIRQYKDYADEDIKVLYLKGWHNT